MTRAALSPHVRKSSPSVQLAAGGWIGLKRWLALHFMWLLDRRLAGGVVFSSVPLSATEARLRLALREIVIKQNRDERLRRAANVTAWVVNGLVATEEMAAEVARYEVRSEMSFCRNGQNRVSTHAATKTKQLDNSR